MANEETSAGATPAIFRQLHIKLPTPALGEPTRHHKDSNTWLKKHSQGFLLMHNLKPSYPMGKSMLVHSIDTGELFVNKRFKRKAPTFKEDDQEFKKPVFDILYWTSSPPELRFSTLIDAGVAVQLPNESYFPKLHAYGGPPEREESDDEEDESDIYSLYFQHYNGGTLSNLMEMYSDKSIGSPVPESFIWHVMEQLSRAILHLHCGYTQGEMDLCYDENSKGSGGKFHVPPAHKQWRRIVHRAVTPENVLLHFAEGDDPVERCFPRIILEGFDKAGFPTDDREYWSRDTIINRGRAVEIGPSAFEDIHLLGELLRRLATVYDGGENNRESRLDYNVNVEGRLSPYLSKTLDLGPGQERAYSSDLINLLGKWEIPALQEGDGTRVTAISVHKEIRDIYFLRDEVFPMAFGKVTAYMADWGGDSVPERDHFGDVSWVKPDPAFETIPYSTTRHREEKILEQYEVELKWLFGPYIPVWYRYDAVGITNIPAKAKRFYTITEGLNADEEGDEADTEDNEWDRDRPKDEATRAVKAEAGEAAEASAAEAARARAAEAAETTAVEAAQARATEYLRTKATEPAQARDVRIKEENAAEDAKGKAAKDTQAKTVEKAAAEGAARASQAPDQPPPRKSRRILTRAATKATVKAESEAGDDDEAEETAAVPAPKPTKTKPAPKPKPAPKAKPAPKPKPGPKPKAAPKPKVSPKAKAQAKRPAKITKPISPDPIELQAARGTQVSPRLQFRRTVQERVTEALEVLEQVTGELNHAVAWQQRERERERERRGGDGDEGEG